ncbi:MAG TPA: hypothetical protein VFI95_25565 [Terriglobales bacterium]|nr:hypothetical protein [Terriglobales bacterium]
MVVAKRIASLLTLFLLMLGLAGCPTRTKISDINRDPGKYSGKEVTIAGKVSGSYGALGSGVFQIDDGSGSMWVYSQNFGVPSDGSKAAVTGRIAQGFSFGGRSFATIMRETQPRH